MCKLEAISLTIVWVAVVFGADEALGRCDFSRVSEPVTADAKIRWLPKEQRCEPDLCKDLQLNDIPDASEHLPVSLFCSLNMYDPDQVLKRLGGKYIVMYGDSTMEENMYDLIILLSDMSRDKTLMESFMLESVWQDRDVARTVELPLHGDRDTMMSVAFHASGRNVSINVPSHDILIKFRFTGHHLVKENYGGISTFSEPLWLAEYRCMVESIGSGCTHKYPDFIIVNSGAHDTQKSLDEFSPKMHRLANWLGDVQSKLGTRVIWRGNNGLGSLHAYETITRYYIERKGISFLDVGAIFTAFKADLQTDCCSDETNGSGLHVGVIGKYFYNRDRKETYIHVSSMVTQGLLDMMLREIPEAGCLRSRDQEQGKV